MARLVNRERQLRAREQTTVYLDCVTLARALAEIKDLIKTYGKDAKLEYTREQYSDSDKEYLRVFVEELETDEELAARIAYEEKWAKIAEEREAAEWVRLQKKFGAK